MGNVFRIQRSAFRTWKSQLLFPNEELACFVTDGGHPMEGQRVALWCKVLGKLVEVVLVRGRTVQPAVPGVSEGWRVMECLDKDTACFGKGCPFTTDGGETPFGEVGELPDLRPERRDPSADPGFEGEWN